jgi:hypothetical protein
LLPPHCQIYYFNIRKKVHIQAVFNKNGPRYNFAIDDPNEKNYTANQMALKTLQT